MRYYKKHESISATNFTRLTVIFISKSWEIDDGDNNFSLFNRFCNALAVLSEDEQTLVLELTENFTKIDPTSYFEHLANVLKKFIQTNQTKLVEVKTIYIAPLLSPRDFGKSKSSTTVQYFFKTVINMYPEITNSLADKNIVFTDGLEVNEGLINKKENILLLVDDFIGSGGTAIEAVDYLKIEKNIEESKIFIIVIAILEIGERELICKNIPVYYIMKFVKGITDRYAPHLIPEKISLMESIESKIKVHKNERLGYNNSEALISLMRTPNNTFPVFWKENKGRIAPFPR